MSASFTQTPTTPNFCSNELLYKVNGSKHIIANGTPIVFRLVASGSHTAGSYFSIPLPDGSEILFTFDPAPADATYELTALITAAQIKTELEAFLVIQDNYTITTIDSTTIEFTSIQDGRTDIPSPTSSGSINFTNWSPGSQIQAHTTYTISGTVELPAQSVPISVDVDENGNGQIDISAITGGQIVPDDRLSNAAVIADIGGVEAVTVRLAEVIDGNAYKTITSALTLLPGKSDIAAATILAAKLCSLLPGYYEITESDHFILNKAYSSGTAKALFTFYHVDGTTSTYTTVTVAVASATIISLLCGPADITFPENVVYYEVYFMDGSTKLSDTYTFRIIDISDYRTEFAYTNQYGCIEIFHADDVRDSQLRIEQTLMKFQRTKGRNVTDTEHSYMANTGLQPVNMIPVLKDFFSSNTHFVHENGVWVPILITSSDFDLQSESNTMNNSTFTYAYANE